MSKALRISDLTVGDWVKVGGEPARVLLLGIAGRNKAKGLSGQIYGFLTTTEIEPIPITPEILKKNEVYVRWLCVEADPIGALYKGDETYHTKCEKFYKCSDFVIHSTLRGEKFGRWQFATNDERRGFKGRTVLANINYVHELQQALRLAGINKEIVM